MDEYLFSWVLEAMYVQVEIFYYAGLPETNELSVTQPDIFQGIFIDDDYPSAGHT